MAADRNRLGAEQSPYLLQHKDNPVWWQPWGREAFDAARERDVPVFLSVGYSTCHWCHVMAHESFEHEDVARALNDGFVSIKVDREERPDVDGLYMEAVQAMGQNGGWPMSVWMTPDGQPFFGGTYFPRAQFLELLARLREVWTLDRASVVQAGAQLADALRRSAVRERAGSLDASLLTLFAEQWDGMADDRLGGRRGAPKFPPAYDIQLLLRIARRSGGERARTIATTALDAMARGGIYDHVGGGFHRYSTDERWLVPHFEKMLYDQASLAGAYLDGWLVTGNDEYRLVARETLDYVLDGMTHPEGGFWSAEDADSEGEEGRFYVWTADELRAVLPAGQLAAVTAAFGVTAQGNFEHGTNILNLQRGHDRAGRTPELAAALATLRAVRARRVHPHFDDKVLADWNGLMIASLARAGRALGEARYVAAATRAMRFVLDRMRAPDGALRHRWRDGEAQETGFLDDHAFVIHALIELYQADFDRAWLETAVALQERQDALFLDGTRGDYYVTDGQDATVPVRRVDAWDNVVPAGRSVTAYNLRRLAALLVRDDFDERARAVFESTPREIRRAPMAFAFLLAALDHALDRSPEVAIVGPMEAPATRAFVETLARAYLPNVVVAAGPGGTGPGVQPLLRDRGGNVPLAYVCEHGACSAPTDDPAEALRLASRFTTLAATRGADSGA